MADMNQRFPIILSISRRELVQSGFEQAVDYPDEMLETIATALAGVLQDNDAYAETLYYAIQRVMVKIGEAA